MRITKHTKTKEVLPLLNAENIDKLLEGVPAIPFTDKPITSFTIAEFSEMLEDRYYVRFLKERKALVAFGKIKDFKEKTNNLSKYLKRFDIKQSQEEKAAAIGIEFPTMIERMLIEVTQFFHLSSFEEAEKHTVADYIMILKDKVSDVKYQKNYNRIVAEKSKLKRPKR